MAVRNECLDNVYEDGCLAIGISARIASQLKAGLFLPTRTIAHYERCCCDIPTRVLAKLDRMGFDVSWVLNGKGDISADGRKSNGGRFR